MSKNRTNNNPLAAQYPSNSKKSKRETDEVSVEPRAVQKIVQGKVSRRKVGFGQKAADAFLESDGETVGSYILTEVIIPEIKNLLFAIIGGGAEMFLFGGRAPRSRSRNSGGGYVSYDSMHRSRDDKRDSNRSRDISREGRSRHRFDEIVLESRREAEDVLSHLTDLIREYDQVTIADFYDLLGISGTSSDYKYGWDDLRSASVSRVRGGYIVSLPKPIIID